MGDPKPCKEEGEEPFKEEWYPEMMGAQNPARRNGCSAHPYSTVVSGEGFELRDKTELEAVNFSCSQDRCVCISYFSRLDALTRLRGT